jgi:hypothetical protein
MKERANETGERYNKGRTAGVEGTYGESRKGVAERTVVPKNDQHDSGGEDGLPAAAGSIYSKAVRNGGGFDTGGDPALRER